MVSSKTWNEQNYYERKAVSTPPTYTAQRSAHGYGTAQDIASATTTTTTVTGTDWGSVSSGQIYTYNNSPVTREELDAAMDKALERHLDRANQKSLEQWVLEHPEARKFLEHALASGAPHTAARDEHDTMVAEIHDLLHLLDDLYAEMNSTIPTPAWAAIGAAADTIRRLRDLPRVTLPSHFTHPWGSLSEVEEYDRLTPADCQACWYVDLYDGPVPRCLDCGAATMACRCDHGSHIDPCALPPATC